MANQEQLGLLNNGAKEWNKWREQHSEIQPDLSNADLSNADLSDSNLTWSNISEANCRNANLTGCNIYAISAWNVHLQETIQIGLIITPEDEATITVDNLEVAQFI